MSKNSVLSPRETQIIQLAAQGKTYRDIASILEIDYETVVSHLKCVRLKLNTSNMSHSIAVSIRQGII